MKNILTYILITFTIFAFSQVKGTVIDKNTNIGIAYINIWIENENIGTTSNEKGEFTLNINDKSKTIIFSGIGYQTKKVEIEIFNETIKLKPLITELPEVNIISKKETKELSVDNFRKSKKTSSFATSSTPWMIGKFFPYKNQYKETSFIKKFIILTRSRIKNAKFSIRLYTKGKDGKPNEFLYGNSIFGIAKKGKKKTEIDVSELNIQFPKDGFFIVTEWLIIDSNKYKYTYNMMGSKEKHFGVSYEPTFVTIPKDTGENSWIYTKGKWKKVWRNSDKTLRSYKGRYNQIAVELILTN